MRTFYGALLLLLASAAPAAAISLSVVPAQPVEGTFFTLVASVNAACPVPGSVVVNPLFLGGSVQITFVEACSTSPQPRLVQVPLGPFRNGLWTFNIRFGTEQATLQAEIQPIPYQIEFPAAPLAGTPITVAFSFHGNCPFLGNMIRDGNLLSLLFDDSCPVLPPAPEPMTTYQEIGPLPAGDYVLQISNFRGESLASQRFHVFGADECIPSDTVLCLQRGRFRVGATWRTASDQGTAKVRPETADSGSLWFFSADNLELMVKVLDACQNPDPSYWVFASGLTDVEVEITVTDMATQTTRHYRNPRGTPFAPIQDTAAFACAPPNT
jgi:hypothetical protein